MTRSFLMLVALTGIGAAAVTAQSLVFTNAHVVNVLDGTVTMDATVTIADGNWRMFFMLAGGQADAS